MVSFCDFKSDLQTLEALQDLGASRRDFFAPKFPDRYFMVINFPKVEGVLLHQTNIPRKEADIRVAWRVSEGEELYDCDSVDDNILQVNFKQFLRRKDSNL